MHIDKQHCRITEVKIEDVSEIFQIETASYVYPWSMQSIVDQINNKNGYNRAISIDTTFFPSTTSGLVGYIFGYLILSDLYITNICIHPNFLKKKLASFLLENLLHDTRILNIKSIFLEVRKSNFPAKALYDKFNFVEDGERKNFYSDGETAMLLHLDV